MLNRKFDLHWEHLAPSMRVLPFIKLFRAVADIRGEITAIQLVDPTTNIRTCCRRNFRFRFGVVTPSLSVFVFVWQWLAQCTKALGLCWNGCYMYKPSTFLWPRGLTRARASEASSILDLEYKKKYKKMQEMRCPLLKYLRNAVAITVWTHSFPWS